MVFTYKTDFPFTGMAVLKPGLFSARLLLQSLWGKMNVVLALRAWVFTPLGLNTDSSEVRAPKILMKTTVPCSLTDFVCSFPIAALFSRVLYFSVNRQPLRPSGSSHLKQ